MMLPMTSTPRVTRVIHQQFRGKPKNPPARKHDGKITGKTCLAQRSNPGFSWSPITAHQCLTPFLHQLRIEHESSNNSSSPPTT
ncbi:hypothetical protein HanIR_Chr13g0664191 [Helianthus annuus]|nr:hypothetical protein HanIR_Chr13g0664191 [Helianthus annuus]